MSEDERSRHACVIIREGTEGAEVVEELQGAYSCHSLMGQIWSRPYEI